MSDIVKPDFGLAGQMGPRVAITNWLCSPHIDKSAFLPDPQRFLLKVRQLPQEL
jgi:hypothetical protein